MEMQTVQPVSDKAGAVEPCDTVELAGPVADGASGRHLAAVPFEPVPSRRA